MKDMEVTVMNLTEEILTWLSGLGFSCIEKRRKSECGLHG